MVNPPASRNDSLFYQMKKNSTKSSSSDPLMDSEEEMCPVCKSTKYLNPKLTLLVSPCYHRLCETCINRIFTHGSAPCPLCGTTLRKGNFVVATFGDLVVEKELRIRKIVSKAFYKRLEDFDTLKEYNDYLEEVEDIVFNLVNDVNVQSTYSRLEAFKSENREALEKNLARLANEQRQAQIEEEAERQRRERLRAEAEGEIEKEKIELIQVKQKFINDLAKSSAPAAVILAEAQKTLKSSSSTRTSATNRNINNISDPVETRRSKRTVSSSTTSTAAVFDALKHVKPLSTRLPLPDLDSIPPEIVLDLFADYWPPAPSSRPNWNIEQQMRAAGYSLDLITKHCLKAALSWGL